MEKNRTVQRKKSKKRGRPKVKFSFGMLFSIIFFSFVIIFVLYMLTANLNENFLSDEFGISTSVPKSGEGSEDTARSSNNENPDIVPDVNDIANPVPQSDRADDTYLDNCCLVTDKTLAGINGFSKGSVFGGEVINTSNVMTEKLESSFGTLSAYDIIKQKKPQTLYIMLGSELGTVSADDMTESYTNFVNSLKSALPNMTIYVMQYPPVLYDSDTLTNEMVNDYNNKLLMMCNNLGVYCIDTNTALKSESGKLNEELWSYETLSLSQEGYDKVIDYILTHVVR